MPEALAAEAIGSLLVGDALAIGAGAEAFGAAALSGAAGAGTAGAVGAGLGAEALGSSFLTEGFAGGVDALTGASLGATGEAAGAGILAEGFAGGVDPLTGAQLHTGAGLALPVTVPGGVSESPTSFNRAIDTGGTFGGLEALSAAAPLSFGAAAVPAASTGAAFSFPSISQLGSGLNIATSLYGLSQADQMKKLAMLQANKASPWQSAGGSDLAAQQLMALISGKTDVSTMPGYKAGLQAVERRMAAQGFNGSGNMMAALQEQGGKFYNDAIAQLAGLAGTQFNPASSGAIAMGGFNNAAATNLAAMSNINKTIETQPAWR